jgi:hypothetical protein
MRRLPSTIARTLLTGRQRWHVQRWLFGHPLEVITLGYTTSDAADNLFFTCRATILFRRAERAEDRK